MVGNLGTDSVDGGPGDQDVVRGDLGFDRIDGGAGARDMASFTSASEGVTADLIDGTAEGDGHDTLAGVEDLIGSAYEDTLDGDGGPNRLDGGPGYDSLAGRGGEDELYGGPDGARCSGSGARDACGARPTAGLGTSVVRSQSIDGDVTLSIHGLGSANAISVARDGADYLVKDASAPILPSNMTGCELAPQTLGARCPDHVSLILIDVDGGDDSVTIAGSVPAGVQVRIDGGSGADDLAGGAGDDIIEAGDDSDPDRLSGGPGDDGLIGRAHRHPDSLQQRPVDVDRRRRQRPAGRRRPLRRRPVRRRRRPRQRLLRPLQPRRQRDDRRRRDARRRRLQRRAHRALGRGAGGIPGT